MRSSDWSSDVCSSDLASSTTRPMIANMIIPEILPEGAVLIEASHERRSRLVNTAWRCRDLGCGPKKGRRCSRRKTLSFTQFVQSAACSCEGRNPALPSALGSCLRRNTERLGIRLFDQVEQRLLVDPGDGGWRRLQLENGRASGREKGG